MLTNVMEGDAADASEYLWGDDGEVASVECDVLTISFITTFYR